MRKTPLHDEHLALGGRVIDFHGWALPVQYVGIVQEHVHTRTNVALFDTCHMGEFVVRGQKAREAVDRLICNDTLNLPLGRCRYGAMLNDDAGIVDDTVTMRLGEDESYVVTNAGPIEEVAALMEAAGAENVSDATAKIDVQGPGSRDVLLRLGLDAATPLRFYTACRTEWRGVPIVLSRTGYTGELGYELYMPNDLAVPLWRALLEVEGVAPAGLGARDTLRTEMGYPLSGQDFDASRTPLEAGMERFIAWDKEFVGRDALTAKKEQDDYPVITAIRTEDRRSPRPGFEVKAQGTVVGTVVSGTYGPSVGYGIGLAYLPQAIEDIHLSELTAGPKDLPIAAVELPFYTGGTCRA
jgi:aminomethyltransferase